MQIHVVVKFLRWICFEIFCTLCFTWGPLTSKILKWTPTQHSLSRENSSCAVTKGVPGHHEFAKDYHRIIPVCLQPCLSFHNTLDSRILRRINDLKSSYIYQARKIKFWGNLTLYVHSVHYSYSQTCIPTSAYKGLANCT